MKALLLDADGVVLKKGEYFSEKFARDYNIPMDSVGDFFTGPFGACQEGKKDLKEELTPYLQEWNWEGSTDDFLDYWFEDVVIDPAIETLLQECKKKGIACYLASNNESYRARRIEKVLGDRLDGYFFSADLKVKKENPDYFRMILESLEILPSEVGFTDNEEKNVEAAKEIGIQAKLYKEGVISEMLTEGILQEFKTKLQ